MFDEVIHVEKARDVLGEQHDRCPVKIAAWVEECVLKKVADGNHGRMVPGGCC